MDGKAFLQTQLRIQRALADAVIGGVTEEQANGTPPGTCNTIATIVLHVAGTDDALVHARAQGKPLLWESGNWAERIGLPMLPGRAGYWAESNAATLPLAAILEYQAAVRAALDDYVAGATDEELARVMPSPFGEQPLYGVLGLLVVHASLHFGEIAALKGAQGLKGLPF